MQQYCVNRRLTYMQRVLNHHYIAYKNKKIHQTKSMFLVKKMLICFIPMI